MEKLLLVLVLFGLLLVGARANAQRKPTALYLDTYKWKNRPLLIFTPSESNAAYQDVLKAIEANAAGIQNRDMVIIALVGQDKVYLDGKLEEGVQGQALRERFRVHTDVFAALLVGKDGSEKYRCSVLVGMEEIFSLIDRMPMRRQEMRDARD